MSDLIIKIDDLYKQYRLGLIGGGTLQQDLQSWWLRVRGKEDINQGIYSAKYKKNETFLALKGINLEVKKGDTVGIIGANGAGKLTMLKILSRVTAPTKGKVYINGRISSMLEVGTGFSPELTGRENIYLNGAILGMTKAEVDRKIEQIIDFSEVRQFIETPVKRYSSGMFVKLAFAVAAHLDNEIMIMDEVLAVGDIKFQQKCIKKMSDVVYSEGRTILYVSHNMNTIRQLCNRCIVLDKGKLIYDGTVDEAIKIYMEQNTFTRGKIIDLLEYRREGKLTSLVILNKLEILNSEENMVFDIKSKLKFKLNFTSTQSVEKLSLKIMIQNADGTAIGTTSSGEFVSYANNDNYVIFDMDTNLLIDGLYALTVSVCQENEFGTIVHDSVKNAFIFELKDKDDEKNTPNISCGSIVFPKVEIVETNRIPDLGTKNKGKE